MESTRRLVVWGVLLTLLATFHVIQSEDTDEIEDKDVVKVVVESCSGWRLNRLPEVKSFIFTDIPLFHNAEFKKKPGAPPVLMLQNAAGQTVESIDLSSYKRDECNDLLLKRGFYKKSSADEEVPEEYQNGPYQAKQEL